MAMISEKLREVSALENFKDAATEWVLLRAQMLQTKRAQKAFDNIKGAKNFDSIRQNIQRCCNVGNKKQKQVESCKCCNMRYAQRQCPVYGKMCGGCSKPTTFGKCADK